MLGQTTEYAVTAMAFLGAHRGPPVPVRGIAEATGIPGPYLGKTAERCMLSHQDCSLERSCPAHEFCRTHRARQIAFLRRTTLVDIMRFEARRQAPATQEPDHATR